MLDIMVNDGSTVKGKWAGPNSSDDGKCEMQTPQFAYQREKKGPPAT